MLSDYVRKIRQHVGHDKIWLPAVTAVVTRPDGKFLLLHHSEMNCWVFPGGAVEFGESLEVACLREVKEETGIDVRFGELLHALAGPENEILYPNGDRVAYLTAFYHCHDDGSKAPILTEEAKKIGYYSLDEIEMLDVMPWMKVLLPIVRAKLGGA